MNKTKGYLMLIPFLLILIYLYAYIFGWYLPVIIICSYAIYKYILKAIDLVYGVNNNDTP